LEGREEERQKTKREKKSKELVFDSKPINE
jgi:hypothetical protein